MKRGKCFVQLDDYYDGRIDFSKLSPVQLENDEDCQNTCKLTTVTGCRYTDNGICLYDFLVPKIKNQGGPFYYECEIIKDGKMHGNGL